MDFKLNFITPVWGKTYIDRMFDFGIPSQLAEGNLPAIRDRVAKFIIVTRPEDAESIRNNPGLRRLEEVVPVEIRTAESDFDRPLAAMTAFYNFAIREGYSDPENAFVLSCPDAVWCDGSLAVIVSAFERGYRAVAVPGFRISLDKSIDTLHAAVAESPDGSLGVTGREGSELVIRNPHPMSQAHFVEDGRSEFPAHLYFKVDDDGLLAHCYHIHPLAIWPDTLEKLIPENQTADHDYLQHVCELEKVYLPADSDEFLVLELSPEDHRAPGEPDLDLMGVTKRQLDLEEHVRFSVEWTNTFHREFSKNQFAVHRNDIDEAVWKPVRDEARAFNAAILGGVIRASGIPYYSRNTMVRAIMRRLTSATSELQKRVQSIRKEVGEIPRENTKPGGWQKRERSFVKLIREEIGKYRKSFREWMRKELAREVFDQSPSGSADSESESSLPESSVVHTSTPAPRNGVPLPAGESNASQETVEKLHHAET